MNAAEGSTTLGNAYLEMDLLRFTTAGSVDDGKSTLIGRLLYDSKAIFEDQLEAIEQASRNRGEEGVNLALLTDGLRAEREQGITIDVAYRFFATPNRKFIVADTPGHVQYTRNMVTGASTADLAVVLIDARHGVLTQSKRHGFIASLLRIPHVVVAVNKMDLVEYSEKTFAAIEREYTEFSAKLDINDITFIPVSALNGDNVVDRSVHMDWYRGPTFLHHLEHVNIASDRNLIDFRFPVQSVIRPHQNFRGYAGTISSGVIRPGEEVMVLPSGKTSRVKEITTFEGDLESASADQPVVITIEDEIDISRGDMLVRPGNIPDVDNEIGAMVCWMSEEPLDRNRHYIIQHTTREVKAFVDNVAYRVDVDTLHREEADTLQLNEIGRIELTTAQPLYFDSYRTNQETGAFILVDPFSHNTVAAGMIRGATRTAEEVSELAEAFSRKEFEAARQAMRSPDVVWEGLNIPREEREAANDHLAAAVWFTGLSGSGKTTIARVLERRLFDAGVSTMLLDGDYVRHGLCGDLGFSATDRAENIRRVGEAARLFFEQGSVVLCTFVSPYRVDRDRVRALVPEGRFMEVFVDVDLETARERDPKGLYEKSDQGDISNLTGVSAPYEAPESPELTLETANMSVDEAADMVWKALVSAGIIEG